MTTMNTTKTVWARYGVHGSTELSRPAAYHAAFMMTTGITAHHVPRRRAMVTAAIDAETDQTYAPTNSPHAEPDDKT